VQIFNSTSIVIISYNVFNIDYDNIWCQYEIYIKDIVADDNNAGGVENLHRNANYPPFSSLF
jgi:hypothetical protein